MAANRACRIFESESVKIRPGDSDQILIDHREVLSNSGSPSLRALVNGDWKESPTGIIEWSRTDASTTVRALTFLYVNDYCVPEPTPRDTIEESARQIDAPQNVLKCDSGDLAGASFHPQQVTESVPDDEPGADTVVTEVEAAIEVTESLAPPSPGRESPLENVETQNAMLESWRQRPLTPVGRCVDAPLVALLCRTAAGVFEDLDFPLFTT